MSDDEIAQKLKDATLDEDTFDFPAKKKKSKKIQLADLDDEEAATAPSAGDGGEDEDDDDVAAFAGLKKKKKSKAKVVMFDDENEAEEGKDDADMLDMSAIKKKKKKSKKSLAAFEAELGGDETAGASAPVDKAGEPWVGTDRDYTYQELLGRFYQIVRDNNMEVTGKRAKYTIVPPVVAPEGRKRTIFANIDDIARRMRRQPEHVIRYLYAELGTTGSVDQEQRLLIRGRYKQKQIETVLRHYIGEYVACKTCKSGETTLTKDKALSFIKCEGCGSSRTVAAIVTGFEAATRDKRRAKRDAAAGA